MAINKKPFHKLYDYTFDVEDRVLKRGANAVNDYKVQYSVWADELGVPFVYSEIRGNTMNQMLGSADTVYIYSKDYLASDLSKVSFYAQKVFEELTQETGIQCVYATTPTKPRGLQVNEDSLRYNAELDFKNTLNNSLDGIKKNYGLITELELNKGFSHSGITNTAIKIYVNQQINGEQKKGAVLAEGILSYPGTKNDLQEMVNRSVEDIKKERKLADNIISSTTPQKKELAALHGNPEGYIANLADKLDNEFIGRKTIENTRIKIHASSDKFAVTFIEGSTTKFNIGYSYEGYKSYTTNNDISEQQEVLHSAALEIIKKTAEKYKQPVEITDMISKVSKKIEQEKDNTLEVMKQLVAEKEQLPQANDIINKPQEKQKKPEPEITFSAKELMVIDRKKIASNLRENSEFFKFALATDKAITDFIDGKGEVTSLNLINKAKTIHLETIIDGVKQPETSVSKEIPAEYFEKYLKEEAARANNDEFLTVKTTDLDPLKPIDPDKVNDRAYAALHATYSSAKKLFTNKENETDFSALSKAINSPDKIKEGVETIR